MSAGGQKSYGQMPSFQKRNQFLYDISGHMSASRPLRSVNYLYKPSQSYIILRLNNIYIYIYFTSLHGKQYI